MSRLISLLSLLLGLGLPLVAAPLQDPPPDHPRLLRKPPARPPAPPRLERMDLERGTRLIVIEDDRDELVDGRLIFRGGSLREDPDEAGLAALAAEVLVAGGTAQTSGTELEDWLDLRAASIVASSDLESFRIDFSCFVGDINGMLEKIGELLAIPAYPEEEVEQGKQRLLERLDRRSRHAREVADRALYQVVYGGDSPLARPPVQRTLARLTREDLERFHRTHLGVDRLVVGMVGELRSLQLAARMEVILRRLPVVGPLEESPGAVFLRPARTRVYLYDRPGVAQAEIRIAGPGTRRIHQDTSALELWSEAADSEGRVGFRPEWERAGLLLGKSRVPSGRVGEAVGELLQLLHAGVGELSPEELSTARERVLSAGVFALDHPEEALARALEIEFHGYPESYREQRLDELSTLGAKEISEAVSRHLDLDRLVIVAVGSARKLEHQLAVHGEITRIDPPVEGAALIEKIFAGLGGREAWGEVRFIECEIQHAVSADLEMKLHIWQDLASPRMRVEQELRGVKSSLVVNEEGAWMRSSDSLVELPPAKHEELLAASWRDVHRLLRQLAISEGNCVKSDDALRFEVVDGPARNTWIELDDAGHPSRVGYPQGEEEVILGFSGWRDFDGVYAPTEIEKVGGWTRRFESLVVHEALDDQLFERP